MNNDHVSVAPPNAPATSSSTRLRDVLIQNPDYCLASDDVQNGGPLE